MAVTLNDITKYIKFNNTNIKFSLNTNSEFEQSFNIPDKVLDPNLCLNDLTNNIENNDSSSNNILQYKYDDIIDLPNTLCSLLDLNNYYSYGVNEDFMFIYSLLYVYNTNFKLLSEKDKENVYQEFKQELLDKISSFKGKTTGKVKMTAKVKTNLNEAINENNFTNETLLKYISDIYSLNILILDLNDKKYTSMSGEFQENSEYTNIVILKSGDYYFPLVHMFGIKLEYEIVEKIMLEYK